MLDFIPEGWKYGIVIVVVVVVIVAVTAWASNRKAASVEVERCTRSIIREAVHQKSLCEQDQNPAYALMHANYAMAYISAARQLMSDWDIQRSTNIDIKEFAKQSGNTQQQALMRLGDVCPHAQSDNQYSVVANWL